MKKKATTILLTMFLMFAMVVATVPMAASAAGAGTVTTSPTKAVVGTPTILTVSGSDFTQGASLYYKIKNVNEWGAAPPSSTFLVTLPVGQSTIPLGTTITATIGPAGTWYFIVSEDSVAAVNVVSTPITVIPAPAPGLTVPALGQVGDVIAVTGTNWAPGYVTIYWGYVGVGTAVGSGMADATGALTGTFTVPSKAAGPYNVIVMDSAGLTNSAIFTVNPKVVLSPTIIDGQTGTTFTATGTGFAAGMTQPADTITVSGVATTHPAFTTTALGEFGPITITLAGTVPTGTRSVAILGLTPTILVSTPTMGGEVVTVTPGAGVAGDSIVVSVINFPAYTTVQISIGSVSLGSILTQVNGAGSTSFLVPEMPRGAYLIYAKVPSQGLIAITAAPFAVNPALSVSVAGMWVADGTQITLTGTGFLVEEYVTITDSALPGTVGYRWANAVGTFEMTYWAAINVPTGNPVTIVATGDAGTTVTKAGVYTAIRAPSITLSAPWAKAGDIITPTFTNLRPTTDYQLYLDGTLLTLTIGAVTQTFFETDGTGAAPAMTFAVPDRTAGFYTVDLVYKDTAPALTQSTLAWAGLKISVPGTTAYITVDATNVVAGESIAVTGFNFIASETPVTVAIIGVGTTTISANSVGGFDISWMIPPLPQGTHAIYVVRAPGNDAVSPLIITIQPTLTLTPDNGVMGDTFTVSVTGLEPSTAYVVLWDDMIMWDSTFTTNPVGTGSAVGLFVPAVETGDYYVTVAPLTNPTAVVTAYDFFEVQSGNIEVTPDPAAFPGQLVTFAWNTGVTTLVSPVEVTVLLNGEAYTTTPVIYDSATGWLRGSFLMPNADVGTTWVLSFAYSDSSLIYYYMNAAVMGSTNLPASIPTTATAIWTEADPATDISDPAFLELVSGSGALVMSISDDDIAEIAVTTSLLTTAILDIPLSELDAKIEAVNDAVAVLDTKFGTMSATLDDINATVVSINGTVAIIKTDVGVLQTNLNDINAKIVALNGTVATISTSVEDLQVSVESIGLEVLSIEDGVATMQTTLGTIEGQVVSMNGTVATIQTNLGKVQVDVSYIKGKLPVDMTPVWIAVILALIAVIGVIYVAIRIRKPVS